MGESYLFSYNIFQNQKHLMGFVWFKVFDKQSQIYLFFCCFFGWNFCSSCIILFHYWNFKVNGAGVKMRRNVIALFRNVFFSIFIFYRSLNIFSCDFSSVFSSSIHEIPIFKKKKVDRKNRKSGISGIFGIPCVSTDNHL